MQEKGPAAAFFTRVSREELLRTRPHAVNCGEQAAAVIAACSARYVSHSGSTPPATASTGRAEIGTDCEQARRGRTHSVGANSPYIGDESWPVGDEWEYRDVSVLLPSFLFLRHRFSSIWVRFMLFLFSLHSQSLFLYARVSRLTHRTL